MDDVKLMTREQVIKKLKEKKVERLCEMIALVSVLTFVSEPDSDYRAKLHPVAFGLSGVDHEDGTCDFYSEDNVDKIMDFGDKHGGLYNFIL